MRWAVRVAIGLVVALSVLAWAPRFSEADATVTAIGRLVFRKYGPQVVEVGIRRARVEMCDEDSPFGCGLMAVGETDDNGYFSLTGTAGDAFGGNPDIVVKVIAQSDAGTVEWAGLTGGVFCFKAGPVNDRPHGSTVDFGTLSPVNGLHCTTGGDVDQEDGAWELHNALVEAHQFMRHFTLGAPGREMPSVKVRWPADRTAYDRPDVFSSPNGTIWMGNLASADKYFMKQYGHHVLQHFADNPVPNFNNGSCDSQTDIFGIETGRCRWRSENGAIHWTEGFPIFLSEVLTRFWGHEGFGGWHIGPGPHPHLDEAFHLVPEVTATILWNLVGWATAGATVGMDTDGDNHDANNSVDRVSVGFETIWDVLVHFDPSGDATHNHAQSIQEFWSGMAALYPDLANRVSAVYHESHVVMPAANLKVNMVNASPALVTRGGALTVSDATVNAGAVNVGEQSTTQFFLSTDTAFGPGDIAIGQRTVPNLLPSQDSGASTALTIPSSVPYGAYYVIACADGPGVIFESNEADNCRASGATVQVAEGAVAPGLPTGLGQFKADGTAVPLGAWLNQTTVVLRFTMTDGNGSDQLTPEVEIKAVGTAFNGSGLRAGAPVPSSGAPVQGIVTATGLANQKYHWRARVKDAGGHVSGWVSFGGNGETSGDFAIDTGAPTGSVKIDTGAQWTNEPAVSLKLVCSDSKSGCGNMQLSNDNRSFTAPEPFAANRAWTLTPGDGQKTVYVRYIDGIGNVSKSYQDAITLDTAGPAVGAVTSTPSSFRPALGETTTIRIPVSDQLSGSCSLKIRILGAAGFVAKTVNKTAACSPSGSTVSLTWDGKAASGALVPAGAYFIEVTATDQAGNAGAVSNGNVAVQ
jgi:hypothetical protein